MGDSVMKEKFRLLLLAFITLLCVLSACTKEIEMPVSQKHSIFLVNKYNYNLPDEFSTSVKVIGYMDNYQIYENIAFEKIGTDTFKLVGPLKTESMTTGIEVDFNLSSLKANYYNISFPAINNYDSIYLTISVGHPVLEYVSNSTITSTNAKIKYKFSDAGFTPIESTGINLSINFSEEGMIHNASFNPNDSTYSIDLNGLTPSTTYNYSVFVKYSPITYILAGGFFDTLD